MPRPNLASGPSSLAMLTALSLATLVGCSRPAPASALTDVGAVAPVAPDSPGRRVLVVANAASEESSRIAIAYLAARKIPRENLVVVTSTLDDELPLAKYASEIEDPVKRNLAANKNPIDYIVTTMGVPLRIAEGGYSVDAFLGQFERKFAPLVEPIDDAGVNRALSPYFGRNEAFSHRKFGFYLVTRLTGHTMNDAISLFERGLQAKPAKGPFLLDSQPLKPKDGGYGAMERILLKTDEALVAKGLQVVYDRKPEFAIGPGLLMGYASWGSNDDRFEPAAYFGLRFKPGAIAETFVSTSGRTFRPTTGGQSLVSDLIAQGVTGVKGYVSEPYTFALCHTNVLFDRYTAGFDLADSFYMASPLLKWRDVVVGDPLCSPYAKAPIRSKVPVLPVRPASTEAPPKTRPTAR